MVKYLLAVAGALTVAGLVTKRKQIINLFSGAPKAVPAAAPNAAADVSHNMYKTLHNELLKEHKRVKSENQQLSDALAQYEADAASV